MPAISFTIVVDNEARHGCQGEHGFAVWVDLGNERLLLDTGQGPALAPNLNTLGLKPDHVTHLILSHGHYDHSGGLPWILSAAPHIQVWSHPGAVVPRYTITDEEVRAIGMPQASRQAMHGLPASRLHWSSTPVWMTSKLGLTGRIPRQTDFEDPGGPFFLDPKGQCPDPIEDDQALWIMTAKGLVVCVGCCHAGLINTLTYVQELTGEQRIRAIIGGLHLGTSSDLRMNQTIRVLNALRPALLVPCHCTGAQAVQRLADELDVEVRPGYAGLCLDMTF
ncbi:MBL fold metallo-hydrolase [Desulfovibrionales bacterium]